MRQTKYLILSIACFLSISLATLLLLQSAGIAPPVARSWGDAVRGRTHLVAADGSIVLEKASDFKAMPPGVAIGLITRQQTDVAGFYYRRWNDVALAPGMKLLPGVYGTHVQVRIAAGWPLLLSLALLSLCLVLFVRQRRKGHDPHHCRNCGYDLRATPDRCPECGLVPERGI
jgi:hypothetical protein